MQDLRSNFWFLVRGSSNPNSVLTVTLPFSNKLPKEKNFKNCKNDVSDRHYLNVWFKIAVSNTAIIFVKVIDFTMASGSSTIKHRIKSEYLFSIQAGHYYNVNHNCSPMTSIWKCGFHQNLKNCSCIWSFWQVCLLRF